MSPLIGDIAALQARTLAPYQGRPVPSPEGQQYPLDGRTSEVAGVYAPLRAEGYATPTEALEGRQVPAGASGAALSESVPEAGGVLLPPSFSVRPRRR